jgi:hypothetical protein
MRKFKWRILLTKVALILATGGAGAFSADAILDALSESGAEPTEADIFWLTWLLTVAFPAAYTGVRNRLKHTKWWSRVERERKLWLPLLLVGFLFASGPAWAADDLEVLYPGGNYRVVNYAWTADGTGAAQGITTLDCPGVLYLCTTVPGAGGDAPDDDYDITVKNLHPTASGTYTLIDTDIADAEVDNRDTANTESVDLVASSVKQSFGKIQIDVTNAGDANTGTVVLVVYGLQYARVRNTFDLYDVAETSPTNGETLVFNGATGQYEPGAITAGGYDISTNGLDDLGDVGAYVGLAAGHIIVWSGTEWLNKAVSSDIGLAASGAATIQANAVALTTDTTGNYVATVANAGGLTVSGSGSEGAAVTVALNYNNALTGDYALVSNYGALGRNGFIFEGATADTIEHYIAVPDPTGSDRTSTLPAGGGTLLASGHALTGDVTATFDTDGTTATQIASGVVGASELASTAVTPGNYNGRFTVDADGRITAAATLTKSRNLDALAGTPAVTAGCSAPTQVETTTNDVNYWVLDYDKDTDESAWWTFPLPDDYAGGTLTVNLVWTTTAATGSVYFNINGRAYGDGDALDQAVGSTLTLIDAGVGAGDAHVSGTGVLTLAGTPAAGQLCAIRVTRDANNVSDDLDADARLIAVRLEYVPVTS